MSLATIYDVATKAGVSVSTVSRVLNVPGQVNEVTRQKVLEAIDALGFVPRTEAAIRARRSQTRIGVLAPFFTQPCFVQRLRGVAHALDNNAYELTIYNVNSQAKRDGYLAALPITRRVDGLIIMSLPVAEAVAKQLYHDRFPTVLIEISHPHFNCIEVDDVWGGRMAAEYLIAQGHRKLGFIGDCDVPEYAIQTSKRRLDGYRQAIEQAGLHLPEHYIRLAPHGLAQAHQQAHDLLGLPEPPTAIFAPSDTQAMGVLKAAQERGLTIPQDVAIIGFDDVDMAEYVGLTTIRQPLDESGRVAVELLTGRIADPERPVQHVRLMLTLVQRKTA